MAILDDVMVWLSLAAPPTSTVRQVHRLVEETTASVGSKVTLLVVCTEQTGIPDASSRAESVAFLRDQAPNLAAVAVCFEGQGFRVSALRSVMSGITVAVRRPYRVKLFADRHEAVRWATEDRMTQDRLLEVIGTLEQKAAKAEGQ